MSPDRTRILLLLPSTTYKADDFLAAARELDVDVTVGSERKQVWLWSPRGHGVTNAHGRNHSCSTQWRHFTSSVPR